MNSLGRYWLERSVIAPKALFRLGGCTAIVNFASVLSLSTFVEVFEARLKKTLTKF